MYALNASGMNRQELHHMLILQSWQVNFTFCKKHQWSEVDEEVDNLL